jgi:glycine cleavage system H protein
MARQIVQGEIDMNFYYGPKQPSDLVPRKPEEGYPGHRSKESSKVCPPKGLKLEDDARYSMMHLWVKIEDYHMIVGITDYAQDQLGDIIYVELPEPDTRFDQNEVFGFVESAKSVSDLHMPVGGSVIAINPLLAEAPDHMNKDPYGDGWLLKVLPADPNDLGALMTATDYLARVRPETDSD